MKERAIEQARALLLEVPDRTLVLGFLDTMKLTPELLGTLQSPVVKSNQKIRIVNRVAEASGMSEKLRNFLAELVKNNMVADLDDIVSAYMDLWDIENHHVKAEAIFASQPSDEDLKEARAYLESAYPSANVQLCVDVDPSLMGGRVLRTRGVEYDQSYVGRLKQLERKLTEEAY
jgi:F-type H+-transporting ATPase subunit delta